MYLGEFKNCEFDNRREHLKLWIINVKTFLLFQLQIFDIFSTQFWVWPSDLSFISMMLIYQTGREKLIWLSLVSGGGVGGVSGCCYGVIWWVKHVKAPCPALESLLMDDAEEAALDRPSGGIRPLSNQRSEKSDYGDDGCAKRCYRTFHEDRG